MAKTNWQMGDTVMPSDLNHIGQEINNAVDRAAAGVAAAEIVQDAIDEHKTDKNNPHGVTKAQVGLANVANYAVATQVQAEAGIATDRFMTPLRTAQAIKAQSISQNVLGILHGKTGTWELMSSVPGTVSGGGSLVYTGGDYIYALSGNETTSFYRYSISANSWSTMTNSPGEISGGGSLVYTGGDYIYAIRGNGTTTFYRYSISTNSWSTMASLPENKGPGGSLVYTGGDYIYCTRGSTFTYSFFRYSISTNSWSAMANMPGFMSAGGSLVYTGGDYIYALRGDGYTHFYRYSISGNSWSTLANTPDGVFWGGSLVYTGGDYLYALRGSLTPTIYRYSLSQNIWETMIGAPVVIGAGGGLIYTGRDCLFALQGGDTTGFYRIPFNQLPYPWESNYEDQMRKIAGNIIWAGGEAELAATNGFLRLPLGLLIQWGTVSSSTTVSSATFPIAFGSLCHAVYITVGSNTAATVRAYNHTITGFNHVASASITAKWFALGV